VKAVELAGTYSATTILTVDVTDVNDNEPVCRAMTFRLVTSISTNHRQEIK
jgi:hypothetical protein